MARRSKIVTIEAEGRDINKSFLVTEMSASSGEWWAARTYSAIARSGAIDIPPGLLAQGMVGLRLILLRAFGMMHPEDAKPLLDEMFDCVERIPDVSRPKVKRPLVEEDIEEVSTRLILRKEVLELHTDFLTAGETSTQESVAPAQTTTSS